MFPVKTKTFCLVPEWSWRTLGFALGTLRSVFFGQVGVGSEPAEECDGDYLPAPQPPPLCSTFPWCHTERWTDARGKTALCVDLVSAVDPPVLGIVSRLCLNKALSESLGWWGARCLSGRASALVLPLMWWWASLLLDVSAMLLLIRVKQKVWSHWLLTLIAPWRAQILFYLCSC